MAHIKRFDEINEEFHHSDYINLNLLQDIIDRMKPTGLGDEQEDFNFNLTQFNDKYPVKYHKRFPATFGKQVANWIDLYLIQDVIDRMNPVLNPNANEYKKELKRFLQK
jgi:hypothetical protein